MKCVSRVFHGRFTGIKGAYVRYALFVTRFTGIKSVHALYARFMKRVSLVFHDVKGA